MFAGVMVAANVCRRVVGIGSRGHVLGQLRVKGSDISLPVSGINVEKKGERG